MDVLIRSPILHYCIGHYFFTEPNLEIIFAHKTFVWNSEAVGKAHVHVVIIGLGRENGQKRLFRDGTEFNPEYITPYLGMTNYENVAHQTISKSEPLGNRPLMQYGSLTLDNNYHIFTSDEKDEFIQNEPGSSHLFRRYVGSREFIREYVRYILYLAEAEPEQLGSLPRVRERIEQVRQFRQKSKRPDTRKLANTPREFSFTTIPQNNFLLIPRTSSGKREYVPIGYLEAMTVPSDATTVIQNAGLGLFGLLTSKMHMVWLDRVGGKLKSDYRYSIGLVYNTFPFPVESLNILEPLAQSVLDARSNHPNSTLKNLYDPLLMPADLRVAHNKLDKTVDKLYRKEPFNDDDERFTHLTKLYVELTLA